LAELDVKRYGLGEVHVSGGVEKPCYTNMAVVPLEVELPWEERLSLESQFHGLTSGSHLARVPLGDSVVDAESLLSMTRKTVENFKVGLFTYDRSLTYCSNCLKTFHGEQIKCPECGSVNAVTQFVREPALYRAHKS
jgi:anaerobic ribonucleoside-triphosphate reductase